MLLARAFSAKDKAVKLIILLACQATLDCESGDMTAVYEQGLALALPWRDDEARDVIDLYRFVEGVDLMAPESYAHSDLCMRARFVCAQRETGKHQTFASRTFT